MTRPLSGKMVTGGLLQRWKYGSGRNIREKAMTAGCRDSARLQLRMVPGSL